MEVFLLGSRPDQIRTSDPLHVKQPQEFWVTTFLFFVVTYLRIFFSARYSFSMSSKVGRMLFSFSYACRAA